MAVPARRVRGTDPAGRPRLAPVSPPARRKTRRLPFLVFSVAVVALLVLALTSAQALVAQGAFRISELSERVEHLETETLLLRLRLAKLASPDRIASAARRAGLVLPEEVEVLPGAGG